MRSQPTIRWTPRLLLRLGASLLGLTISADATKGQHEADLAGSIAYHLGDALRGRPAELATRYSLQKAWDLRVAYRIQYASWPDSTASLRPALRQLRSRISDIEAGTDGAALAWAKALLNDSLGVQTAVSGWRTRGRGLLMCGNAAAAESFVNLELKCGVALARGRSQEVLTGALDALELRPLASVDIAGARWTLIEAMAAAALEEVGDTSAAIVWSQLAAQDFDERRASWEFYYQGEHPVVHQIGTAVREQLYRLQRERKRKQHE